VRIHVGASNEPEKSAEEWLLIEWPEGENEPTKYWLSTLPRNISFRDLVDAAKLPWRIERDYQELKQEIGLGHLEGRGWRGVHHYATRCASLPTYSWSPKGRRFPPQDLIPLGRSRNVPYPTVTHPEDPPFRPEPIELNSFSGAVASSAAPGPATLGVGRASPSSSPAATARHPFADPACRGRSGDRITRGRPEP
jgi:hypothetical protein